MIATDKIGTNYLFNRENTWTDASEALHMQIKKRSDRWSCAEIFLNRSLGYGTYSVTVQHVIQPFYNGSEFTKRGRARRVFILVNLLLVAPLTSDRDGDR
jgi:hypothetical protein